MSQQRIFFKKQTAANQEQVAREIIGAFATRAFRRPVEKEELDGLMAIWLIPIHKGESFELSVKLALRAALSSPAFLFRGEVQPDPDNPNKIYPINEYALASRLSYFLWGSMPDDELTQLASRKRLRSNLAEQTYRMLRSNRALGLAESFAMQWLQIRNLDLVAPSEKHFPDFDDQLKEAMRTETEMLFKRVVREDRSVLEFLNADYTYLNERLAKHYGMSGVKGENFRLVSLSNSPRRGVLTHGSVLTITSNPTRTSPVKRGLWVLENILGTPPPPPAGRARARRRQGSHRRHPARAPRNAPRKAGLQFLPPTHGSARLRAGKLRRRRQVPGEGRRRAHRHRRRNGDWINLHDPRQTGQRVGGPKAR
jgi:hypothetical protein